MHATLPQPPLFDLAQVQTLHVDESWVGLGSILPHAEFRFTVDDGLTGAVVYSNAMNCTSLAPIPLRIGKRATRNLLSALAGVHLQSGPYQPYQDTTDDYPSTEFTLLGKNLTVVIRTESQGEHRVPWAVSLDGVEYVTYEEHASHAWLKVNRYLARKEQRQFLSAQAK